MATVALTMFPERIERRSKISWEIDLASVSGCTMHIEGISGEKRMAPFMAPFFDENGNPKWTPVRVVISDEVS